MDYLAVFTNPYIAQLMPNKPNYDKMLFSKYKFKLIYESSLLYLIISLILSFSALFIPIYKINYNNNDKTVITYSRYITIYNILNKNESDGDTSQIFFNKIDDNYVKIILPMIILMLFILILKMVIIIYKTKSNNKGNYHFHDIKKDQSKKIKIFDIVIPIIIFSLILSIIILIKKNVELEYENAKKLDKEIYIKYESGFICLIFSLIFIFFTCLNEIFECFICKL